jgi:hypothetical protein
MHNNYLAIFLARWIALATVCGALSVNAIAAVSPGSHASSSSGVFVPGQTLFIKDDVKLEVVEVTGSDATQWVPDKEMISELNSGMDHFDLLSLAGNELDVLEVKNDPIKGLIMRVALESEDPSVPSEAWVRIDRLNPDSFIPVSFLGHDLPADENNESDSSDLISELIDDGLLGGSDENEFGQQNDYFQEQYASKKGRNRVRQGKKFGRASAARAGRNARPGRGARAGRGRRSGGGVWKCLAGVRNIIDRHRDILCQGKPLPTGTLSGKAKEARSKLISYCGYRRTKLNWTQVPLYSVCFSEGRATYRDKRGRRLKFGHVAIRNMSTGGAQWETGGPEIRGVVRNWRSSTPNVGGSTGCLVPPNAKIAESDIETGLDTGAAAIDDETILEGDQPVFVDSNGESVQTSITPVIVNPEGLPPMRPIDEISRVINLNGSENVFTTNPETQREPQGQQLLDSLFGHR